jgi:hypothetical protein
VEQVEAEVQALRQTEHLEAQGQMPADMEEQGSTKYKKWILFCGNMISLADMLNLLELFARQRKMSGIEKDMKDTDDYVYDFLNRQVDNPRQREYLIRYYEKKTNIRTKQ